MSQDQVLAQCFTALSHPRRAMIFRLLTEEQSHGSTYQALQTRTGLADTTLVHHLRTMERSGLIRRRRTGPTVTYSLTPGDVLRATRRVQSLVLEPDRPLSA